MDTAELVVENYLNWNVSFLTRITECYRCSMIHQGNFLSNTNESVTIDTSWPTEIKVEINSTNQNLPIKICQKNYNFKEYGSYRLFIAPNDSDNVESGKCVLVPISESWDYLIPFYVTVGIIMLLVALCGIGKYIFKKCNEGKKDRLDSRLLDASIHEDLGTPSHQHLSSVNTAGGQQDQTSLSTETDSLIIKPMTSSVTSRRLHSLDTFRGLCLMLMIFVNSKSGGYEFLNHAAWNGLHLADLVFPWFIFIMGTAMAFSLQAQLRRNISRYRVVLHVMRRSLILFLLGLCLNSEKSKGSLADLRIPGVLQRFSVAFLVLGLMEAVFCDIKDFSGPLADHKSLFLHWPVVLLLLIVHTCITFLLPQSDGCPTGYLGPGGRHEYSRFINCTGGAAGFIDRLVFGSRHIYKGCTAAKIYGIGQPHDPEGLLGNLTSIFLCFLGLLAGKIFVYYRNPSSRLCRLLVWGVITGALGTLLCQAQQNGGWIPVNKNLWSVSYILVTGALAYLVVGTFYLLIDVFKMWSGAPIIYLGTNSILVYCASEILAGYLPFYINVPETHAAQLALNIWKISVWICISFALHKKNIIITV